MTAMNDEDSKMVMVEKTTDNSYLLKMKHDKWGDNRVLTKMSKIHEKIKHTGFH